MFLCLEDGSCTAPRPEICADHLRLHTIQLYTLYIQSPDAAARGVCGCARAPISRIRADLHCVVHTDD